MKSLKRTLGSSLLSFSLLVFAARTVAAEEVAPAADSPAAARVVGAEEVAPASDSSTAARTVGAEEVAPTSNADWGEGFALDLSGGLGAVVDIGEGAGLMVALSWQWHGFGVGAYAAAAGAHHAPDEGSTERDVAIWYGGGGLLSWVGREGRLVPFSGLGLGWSKLRLSRADRVEVLEGVGPVALVRGGVLAPELDLFMDLRLDVPLFHVQSERTGLRDRPKFAVIVEGGFRFGD